MVNELTTSIKRINHKLKKIRPYALAPRHLSKSLEHYVERFYRLDKTAVCRDTLHKN